MLALCLLSVYLHRPHNRNCGYVHTGGILADDAYEPFRVAVCRGQSRRDLHHLYVFGGEDRVEGGSELRVPVSDQVAEGSDPGVEVGDEVAGLLGYPVGSWMVGDAED